MKTEKKKKKDKTTTPSPPPPQKQKTKQKNDKKEKRVSEVINGNVSKLLSFNLIQKEIVILL